MTENRFRPQFTPDCTKGEIIFGWIYLAIHMFGFPLLLYFLPPSLAPNITDLGANVIYYSVGLALTMVVFWKLLRREFDHLLDSPFRCISGFFLTYFLWYALSVLTIGFLTSIGLGGTPPNDQAMDTLAKEGYNITLVLGVIAAPILEEVLFRGIAFQSIRKKSRCLAYVVPILLFSLYHVWQFAFLHKDVTYLLFILRYLPISFALTWCYEYTGSLWTAIFFHASNNYLAMSLANYM